MSASGTPARPPTALGAIIMAGGIFGAAALQRIPSAGALLTMPLAAILAIGWIAIAVSLLGSAVKSGMSAHTGPLVGSFAIGTWIAASVVVARMAMLAAPTLLWPVETLLAVSVLIWLWFMPQAVRNLIRIAASPAAGPRPTGLILLATVATQAVALLTFRLFGEVAALHDSAIALMALGAACYLAGSFSIVRGYGTDRRWRLVSDWDNTNCILHGALSISGLTAVVGGVVGVGPIAWFWIVTLAVFTAVEAIEAVRLVARVRALGWREGVLVYGTSQWARNFTFGMFYAFTAAFAGRYPAANWNNALATLVEPILGWGQYVVLLLLVAELALLGLWLAGGASRTG
jgi:hypothetical protein